MIGGDAPELILLLGTGVLWLIDIGEYLCLVHFDKTCFKAYSWTASHPTFPCKFFSYIFCLIVSLLCKYIIKFTLYHW